MFKLLFLVVAGYLIYQQWFKPKARIAKPRPTEEDQDLDGFTPYEEIGDE